MDLIRDWPDKIASVPRQSHAIPHESGINALWDGCAGTNRPEASASIWMAAMFLRSKHLAAFTVICIFALPSMATTQSRTVHADASRVTGPRLTPFHSGFGLLNLEGIRKPAVFACRFLHLLGEQDVVSDDPQSWITRSADGSVQALVWDYSPVVPPAGQTDQSFYRNELPPVDKGTLHLQLAGLKAGRYRASTYSVGYQRNDAYTAYLRMGAPRQLTTAQVSALNGLSTGAPASITEISVENGTYRCDPPLHSNDVC